MTDSELFVQVLSVDAIDMSGKHEVDLDTNIWKVTTLIFSTSSFVYASSHFCNLQLS